MSDDDPWWALREILTNKAPALIDAMEGGLSAYEAGGAKALGAWAGLTLDGPDDDPWWAMGEIVQARDPTMREVIADGLDAYADGGREGLARWLTPGPERTERTAVMHATAVFRGNANAGDQSAQARVGFVVLIECADEAEQLAHISRMLKEGIKCRALI